MMTVLNTKPVWQIFKNDKPDDPNGSQLSDEDDQPLSNYVKTASKQTNHELKAESSEHKHVFQWKERKIEPSANITFNGTFSNPPGTDWTPMQYFLSFFPDSLIDLVVENTNLYSVQKTAKNVNTNREEIKDFYWHEYIDRHNKTSTIF